MADINEALDILTSLEEDDMVSRKVKERICSMKQDLKGVDEDLSLVINRVLSDIEDLSNDVNLQAHVRNELYRLTSVLELVR